MSKQKVLQKYVFKIHSARLRKNRWNLNLPLQEARLSGELISLADSQVLRWIDELNGLEDADGEARRIRSEIKRVRSEPSSLHNKRKIRALYGELDAVQFKPDYMCLVIDKEKDYRRAVKGFTINGVKYVRLLATVGGVKTSTVVFVSERLAGELRRRIDNGRDKSKAIVPAKLEAYRALSCSASVPVSNPRGILVVSDCVTKIKEDVIYLYNPDDDGEPVLEYRDGYEMELDESDGYGLIRPEFAAKWAEDLELDYVPSGFNTRNSFEKGMIFVFPFEEFAEKIAGGKYIVKDVWGNDIDVRTVDLILTESMLKLWSSYQNIEEYVRNCEENHYSFAVTKVSPKRLDSERSLNYQFIQSYDLDDAAIEELVSPTVSEIHDILGGDINKTILYSLGKGLTDRSVVGVPDGAIKALLVEPEMEADPYVRSVVRGAISKRIDQAKIGVLGVHGNYSIVSGDPFILCQHIFGLEETGLLKKGEIFNRYWLDSGADEVAVFRAPMTCHNNIARMKVHKSEDACYWYRYMSQVSIVNAFDSTSSRLNGMDKDGDLVFSTDNNVLLSRLRNERTIVCYQNTAIKVVPTEEDLINSNIDSFGSQVGAITNRITADYAVIESFPIGSNEYNILEYRIMCGQLQQQDSIDAAKGIVFKPMPRSWFDRHAVAKIEDEEKRELYFRICGDKKPRFMIYIYPSLKSEYLDFKKKSDKKSLREFGLTVEEMMSLPDDERSDDQNTFLYYYQKMLPVNDNPCVMNRICSRIEAEFDRRKDKKEDVQFDYTIMKSDAEYTPAQFSAVKSLYSNYLARIKSYIAFTKYERVDADDAASTTDNMREEFVRKCTDACPDRFALCNIVLDMCYGKSGSKKFAWEMCAPEIIHNLLVRNDYKMRFPERDDEGDIEFGGERFSMREITVKEEDDEPYIG